MAGRFDPRYHPPRAWPLPGEQWESCDLASLATEWIASNRQFIEAVVGRGGPGWDAADVISALAHRAFRGRGVTRDLRRHVDGVDVIREPRALLRMRVDLMIREQRREASARIRRSCSFERLAANTPAPSGRSDDAYEIDDGYLRLVEELVGSAATGTWGTSPPTEALMRLRRGLGRTWEIFRRTAPPDVVQEVARWSEEDRNMILLAVFPLSMPHAAVAAYRRLAWPEKNGATTVSATQRRISRLRDKIRDVWPEELRPRGLREATPEQESAPEPVEEITP